MKSSGSVIVSWDFSNGKDVSILIVGRQQNGKVDIINAFQDSEAEELYLKLTTPKLQEKTQQTAQQTTFAQ